VSALRARLPAISPLFFRLTIASSARKAPRLHNLHLAESRSGKGFQRT